MSLNSIRKLEELGFINNDTKYVEDCQGKCSHCGGDNVEFDDSGVDDNWYWYHITCNDCGKESKEWYRIEYHDTEKM